MQHINKFFKDKQMSENFEKVHTIDNDACDDKVQFNDILDKETELLKVNTLIKKPQKKPKK